MSSNRRFDLVTDFIPRGDQPKAITQLTEGIQRGAKHQTLLGVTGSGKSLDYDQLLLILDENGYVNKVKIGEYVDSRLTAARELNGSLHQRVGGSYVLSFNASTFEIEEKEIVEISKHKQFTLTEIILDDNSKIRVTEDHNCYRLRNCRLELCPTESLKVGDYLPASSQIPNPKKQIEFLNLLDYNPNARVSVSDLIRYHQEISTKIRDFLKEEFQAPNWKYEQIVGKTKMRSITGDQLERLLSLLSLELPDVYKQIRVVTKGGDSTSPLIPIDPSFLTFCGLYLSDGCYTKNAVIISNSNKELQEVCKRFARSLSVTCTMSNGKDMRFHSSVLANFFRTLGETAYSKHVIDIFYNLLPDHLSVFLRSLFDGDGWVESGSVQYMSASEELTFDIKNLLLRFGVTSRVRIKKVRYHKKDGSVIPKRYFVLSISGAKNLERYKDGIAFSVAHKNRRLGSIIKSKPSTNVDLFPNCAEFVRDLRSELDLSQKSFAHQIGCNRAHVSMIEHGKRLPSKRLFSKIAELAVDDCDRLNGLLKFNFRKIVKMRTVRNETGYVYDIGVADNDNFIAGLGNVFVHNTFVVANIIQSVQKPTLVISHNKTLAAQLCSEFRAFFPKNAVEYFVSYYDYYQPEAYLPEPDLYIEKDSSINEEIDRLRHRSTQALLTRRDVIIVASVSCIYGLGSPEEYKAMALILEKGEKVDRDGMLRRLVEMQYERNDTVLARRRFRVRGDTVEICSADEENIVRVELLDDVIDRIARVDHVTGKTLEEMSGALIFPARHYVIPKENREEILHEIESEMVARVEELRKAGKLVEAQRLEQRTKYDLEMIKQIGFVSGIENYDRYFDGRSPGEPPYTLLDFFPKDFLTVIDESHVTVPQLQGMYRGDRSRKKNLIDYGFRLPSAYDHRPLYFSEFEKHLNQVIYTSATPGSYELSKSDQVVEQLVRPTGLVDPEIIIRPTKGQVDDLIKEIKKRVERHQRVLVTTLTKRMAEDLAEYLQTLGIKVQYLHSEVETLKRTEILRDLRIGEYDVIVGINLLREGLDLPEVSLVAILDADKESFLRSEVALIQTMGRAARNVFGQVIMYGDEITESMRRAIDETERRRRTQLEYNLKYGVTPETVRKEVRALIEAPAPIAEATTAYTEKKGYGRYSKDKLDVIIANLEEEMLLAAQKLEFERAAKIRDKIKELKEARTQLKEKFRGRRSEEERVIQ